MTLYLFRFDGIGDKPAEDVEQARNIPGVTIVAEAFRTALVIRCDHDMAAQRLRRIAGWTLIASKTTASIEEPHRPSAVTTREAAKARFRLIRGGSS